MDIKALLKPITDEKPTGTDIREDSSVNSIYYAIRDARASARAAERNSLFDNDQSEAESHWFEVLELAPKILLEHSKDLEIACWYCEAAVRQLGFSGLRESFEMMKVLVENFWENLYPQPDEDGMLTRVAGLTGLNGEGIEGVLITPIRNVPITEYTSYSFWQYQQALEAHNLSGAQAKQQKIDKMGFTVADIEQAAKESSNEFFVKQRNDLIAAIETYKSLGAKLDELCGIDSSPPIRNIIDTLEACLGVVKLLGKDKFPVEPTEDELAEETGENTEAGSTEAGAAPAKQAGPVQNRENAFKQMLQIADFFNKTEPHSPIPFVLRKAVKWGNMPLSELMTELVPDQNSLKHYSMLTGVDIEPKK